MNIPVLAYMDDQAHVTTQTFNPIDNWDLGEPTDARPLLAVDDRSGRVRRGANTAGAYWSSYLVKNARWRNLSQAERDWYEAVITIKRTPGSGATPASGGWATEKAYAAGGGSINRSGCGPN